MHDRIFAEQATRPRLLLAYTDAAYASECGRYFRRLGWEVEMVASGDEARELVSEYHPDVVALESALLQEAGWLSGANVRADSAEPRVVLVATDQSECTPDRLRLFGATRFVRRADGAEALAHTVMTNEE